MNKSSIKEEDRLLEYLLDSNGIKYVVDDILGLWVKFEVKRTSPKIRKIGIRYSLSLHNRFNERIMGFDNAHAIEYSKEGHTFEHWHSTEKDKGQPYHYESAGKLLEDFWRTIDIKINQLKQESKHESQN